MQKDIARKTARANIKAMSQTKKEWASGAIADALSGIDEFTRAHKVFVYLGTETEPDTQEIVGLALMLEKVVCVPRVQGDDMKAIVISPFSNFRTNRWDILEPVGSHAIDDIDVAIVPMVAFDGLNRLGHGKGYYDKYLSTHPCYTIGLAFDCQHIDGLQTDAHDVPLDMIVTEKRIITCDGEKINPFGEEI